MDSSLYTVSLYSIHEQFKFKYMSLFDVLCTYVCLYAGGDLTLIYKKNPRFNHVGHTSLAPVEWATVIGSLHGDIRPVGPGVPRVIPRPTFLAMITISRFSLVYFPISSSTFFINW